MLDKTFTFGKGSHETRDEGMCVMEAVAYLAGESHSDHPECASPVITKLAIWLNDAADDLLRQELLADLPWRIVGTRSTPEIEQQRGFMAADWAVRFVVPILLRRAGLEAEAKKLETSPPVVNEASAARAAAAAYAAAYAARAAYAAYAAYAAADNAAGAAAYAARAAYAAYAAADNAARAAAAAARAAYAAYAAADNAAYAAAAAADADLEIIMRSCSKLLDRMIRLTEQQERTIVNTPVLAEGEK